MAESYPVLARSMLATLLQNRTAGGRGAEILGLLIYTYETIRKVCRMFCDLGSETRIEKKGWRNAVDGIDARLQLRSNFN